jgi:hypothetical protein
MAAWLAAAIAGVKPRFIALPIRGPNVVPTIVDIIPMPSHPGITAYEVSTPFRMFPSVSPDVDKIPPPGVVIEDDPVEDPPPRSPLRSPESPDVDDVEELGDVRLCSAVCIEEINCDSVDCTPVPVDVPAAAETAAPCAADPAPVVVCGAAVNGVTFAVAAAEFAA